MEYSDIVSHITKALKRLKKEELEKLARKAQKNVEKKIIEGEAGGGLVKVRANGLGRLLKFEIDDSLLNKKDKQVLCDLIVAAASSASQKAGESFPQVVIRTLMENLMVVE